MSDFSALEFKSRGNANGIQAQYEFLNGYGVSVIMTEWSYGGKNGLYELAVYDASSSSDSLVYDTPVTDDVLGFLTEQDVTDAMQQVEQLPARGAA